MRQRMSEKNVRKIRTKTGLPVVDVLVRGGNGHIKDLVLEDGRVFYMWPDGGIELASRCRQMTGPQSDPAEV